MENELTLGLWIVGIILCVLLIGAWQSWRRLSPTDRLVLGTWQGSNNLVYIFWSNGRYALRPASSFPSPHEVGSYHTSQNPDGAMILTLFPRAGPPRKMFVRPERYGGIPSLVFDNGQRFVRSSIEPFMSQP